MHMHMHTNVLQSRAYKCAPEQRCACSREPEEPHLWTSCTPQAHALQAEARVAQLGEELKLAVGRASTANGQAAELQHEVTALRAEVASLQQQLNESQGRDTEAAAAHQELQAALDTLRGKLRT